MTRAILRDWRSALIDRKLRATLGFLEKLTLLPRTVGPRDIAALRVAGVRDGAIWAATHVCVGFNIITRIADALEFEVPPPGAFIRSSKFLLIFGYDILSGIRLGRIGSSLLHRKRDHQIGQHDQATTDAYAYKLKQFEETVLSGPGALDPRIRKVASVAGALPRVPGSYVKKVWEHAHEITNDDIDALRQIGYSEDQIFELTISAALGAGLMRLESVLSALSYEPSHVRADFAANQAADCLPNR